MCKNKSDSRVRTQTHTARIPIQYLNAVIFGSTIGLSLVSGFLTIHEQSRSIVFAIFSSLISSG